MVKKKSKWLALPITVALLAGLTGPATSNIINTVDGSIGGVNTISNPLTYSKVEFVLGSFKLNKVAYTSDWIRLTGATPSVATGTLLWFVIYVNNYTDSLLDDIRIKDTVDPLQFQVLRYDYVDDVTTPPAADKNIQVRDVPNIADLAELATIDPQAFGADVAWTANPITDVDGDDASTMSPGFPANYSIKTGYYSGAGAQIFEIGTHTVGTAKAQVAAHQLRVYRIKVRVK